MSSSRVFAYIYRITVWFQDFISVWLTNVSSLKKTTSAENVGSNAGLGNVRPTGHIWPANNLNVALELPMIKLF